MQQTQSFTEQLLATKLCIPQPGGQLLPRLPLRALLDQSLHRPLTLVCAPAGFGKTTLVASWLLAMQNSGAQTPPRIAWLSLDEADNRLERFWAYVLAALDVATPGVVAPFLAYLHSGDGPIEPLLTGLINTLLGSPEPLFLVLDDYDLITDPTIHHSLTFLLDRGPPQMHAALKDTSHQRAGSSVLGREQQTGYNDGERPMIEPLTTREQEVLRLLAEGYTNLEIAERLIMAEGTIKTHLAHIYDKLGVHNRTQAVVRARALGMV